MSNKENAVAKKAAKLAKEYYIDKVRQGVFVKTSKKQKKAVERQMYTFNGVSNCQKKIYDEKMYTYLYTNFTLVLYNSTHNYGKIEGSKACLMQTLEPSMLFVACRPLPYINITLSVAQS